MTTFTNAWDSTLPAETEDIKLGASRIRNLKVDIVERMAVDHSFTLDANDGAHKKITLLEQAADPGTVANTGYLYTKDVAGVTELFWKNSAGAVGLLNRSIDGSSISATVRADVTDFTGESLEGTLSDTSVDITAFHGVAGVTYTRKCLGAGKIVAGSGLTILQGGADITTELNGTLQVYMLTSTTSEVRNYQRAVIDNGARQLQSVSATVASSALTIGALPLTLEFRSTTAGDGTHSTVSGTPANLVISAGSTLGTVNAVQSRIAILAINNAGTIEIAAVNAAGGVNLDETDLISTTAEGGAGAADSATVIYSTTARTNVAYRVIGYVESTQATAGTWATAPSKVQPAGGNVFAGQALAGGHYGQAWQNLTASRVLNTTYTNTTGKPIAFCVIFHNSSASADLRCYVNGLLLSRISMSAAFLLYFGVTIVPNGGTYTAGVYSGTSSLYSWHELR